MKQITIYDKRAKEFANACKYKKATMKGVYSDLEKLKEKLLDVWNPLVLFLNYYKADAPFLGWNPDDPEYENMCNLTRDIETLFLETYILVEKGLGNEIITDDKEG